MSAATRRTAPKSSAKRRGRRAIGASPSSEAASAARRRADPPVAPPAARRAVVAFRVPPRALPLAAAALRREIVAAVAATGHPGRVSVAVVDDPAMQVLNRDFHGCDEPTDVLAFALDRPPGAAGRDAFDAEVVVSLDTARLEAAERGVDPVSELLLYVVHGTLHLMGEDDHDPVAYRRMHERALSILAALGRSNTIDPPESKLGENAP